MGNRAAIKPMASASKSAVLAVVAVSFLFCAPTQCAISVCVPIPRKLKIQNAEDNTIVPIPRAANGSVPSLATNAVSTRPVRGSAMRDKRTGTDMLAKVFAGDFLYACSFKDSVEVLMNRYSKKN